MGVGLDRITLVPDQKFWSIVTVSLAYECQEVIIGVKRTVGREPTASSREVIRRAACARLIPGAIVTGNSVALRVSASRADWKALK